MVKAAMSELETLATQHGEPVHKYDDISGRTQDDENNPYTEKGQGQDDI